VLLGNRDAPNMTAARLNSWNHDSPFVRT
jgi:hypothetical protein